MKVSTYNISSKFQRARDHISEARALLVEERPAGASVRANLSARVLPLNVLYSINRLYLFIPE